MNTDLSPSDPEPSFLAHMGNCASAFLITQSAKALVNMGIQPKAIGHLSKELQDPLHLVSETLIKPAYHFLDEFEKKAGLEAKGIDLIKPDQYHKPLQGLTGKAAPNNLGALKGRILTCTLLGVGMVVCTTKLLIDTLSKGLETRVYTQSFRRYGARVNNLLTMKKVKALVVLKSSFLKTSEVLLTAFFE